MAATNRKDLLEVTQKEFRKLEMLIRDLDREMAEAKDQDDTSIKDVIGHRAHWISLFLNWHADGLAGKTVHFPAEGYKWNDLRRYNADLRLQQAGLSWSDVRVMLNENYISLVTFIEDHSEAELYGGPMQGANNQWTPGRWAEAAGPSHFRSASRYIRSALRAAR